MTSKIRTIMTGPPWLGLTAAALALILGSATTARAAYSDAVLADNPVAYYRLNETSGTIADDQTTPGQDGAYQNSVTLGAAGPRPSDGFNGFSSNNFAPDFAEGDDYALLPVGSDDLGGGYPFTLEAWINTTDNRGYVLSVADNETSIGIFAIAVQPDDSDAGVIRAVAFDSNFQGFPTDVTINDGQWHYVAAVFGLDSTNEDDDDSGPAGTDGTPHKISIYIDPDDSSPTAVFYHNQSFEPTVNSTSIGILARESLGNPLDGRIDETAIYATALTGEQIRSHYQAALVPEPASLALLALGGLTMLGGRRRQRACPCS